mgnify:CR=1 FL=1
MLKAISQVQKKIKVGTHGEDYGSWMSNPVFYVFGGGTLLAAVLAVLSFTTFHSTVLGVIFTVAVVGLLAGLGWITWIRRQYAFGKGGMMEKVHQTILSNLDFDGKGQLLEVGCGSGAMVNRAALTWPAAKVVGLDYWGAMYNYSKAVCEKNARSEGVDDRCTFVHGDANKLDFPDESFDAVISNYVYHNIMGADKQALLLESLNRVGAYSGQVRGGAWQASADFCFFSEPMEEIAGKTIGLIGFGHIGQSVAKIALAFGMNVLVCVPHPKAGWDDVRFVTLDELMKESDVVSLHCPLTEENRRMIDEKAITRMKPGVRIINTARGGLVDESAMAAALESGRVACYMADVLSEEPPVHGSPLLEAKHAILTPHVAWAPLQTRRRLMKIVVGNVEAFVKGDPINVVS